ncbi:MAG TPA: hypothetical protein VMU75_15050 [Acidimicrobiales bacterium]|nr:hypothetical protein [Acidimicrobiales bacterium]
MRAARDVLTVERILTRPETRRRRRALPALGYRAPEEDVERTLVGRDARTGELIVVKPEWTEVVRYDQVPPTPIGAFRTHDDAVAYASLCRQLDGDMAATVVDRFDAAPSDVF